MSHQELFLHHCVNYTRHARLIYCLSTEIILQAFEWLYVGKSLTLKEFYEKDPKRFANIPGHYIRDIKNGKQPKEMDFTFLYQLLQNICGLAGPNDNIWFKEAQMAGDIPLENTLYQIKALRNELSHLNRKNFVQISNQNLDKFVGKLQMLFTSVLTSSAKKAGINQRKLDRAIIKMQDGLRKEQYSYDSPSNKEFLKISLEELLHQFFKRPKTPYLKPRLEEEVTDGKVEGQNELSDSTQPKIFTLKDLFDRKTRAKQEPRVIILSGSTGSGKTSLCRFLARDWLSNSTSVRHLGKYDLVLLLSCRRMTTTDLHYLLRSSLLPNATALYDTLELSTFLKSHRILWLVDGWDEAKFEAKTLIKDLFSKVEHEWMYHKVLVTSKPDLVSKILEKIDCQNSVLKVHLVGLDKTEQGQLLQLNSVDSSSPFDSVLIERFLSFTDKCNNSIKEDLRNPLKFLLIFKIWAEDSSKVITGSLIQLYGAITDSYKKRLLKRLKEHPFAAEDNPEYLEVSVTAWLRELSKVTFESLLKGEGLHLSSEHINILENACNPFVASHCLSAFLEYQQMDTTELNHYSFLHPTQKIFFASLHLVNIINEAENPEQKVDEILQQNISGFEFSHVIDPLLGVYDISDQIQLAFMSTVSKVSNGFLWPHLQRKHIWFFCQSAVKKVIDCLTNLYTKQTPNVHSIREIFPILHSALAIQSADGGLEKWPVRSLLKVIHLLIPEESTSISWLDVLRICQYDQNVLQTVVQYIDTQEWQVTDAHLKAAWELMCYVVPQKIHVSISGDPKQLPDLEILLHLVRQHRIEVQLSLQQHMIHLGKRDLSDDYLEMLCSCDSNCRLTYFSGYLSRQGLGVLQKVSPLKTLAIRIMDRGDVKRLHNITHKLKNLNSIFFIYDLKSYPHVSQPLNARRYFGRFLSVTACFPHLHETYIQRAADFICSFCQHYTAIEVGSTGKRGIKTISSLLTNNKVTVYNLLRIVYIKGIEEPVPVNMGYINVNNETMIIFQNFNSC
ncbi:uncharacterized protein LOC135212948 isoform X1 [Macrobrachium nipponense]|uniref:uncharacterized protein LOC135212948 isoform X1 n=1 Tax=Macrobrachium nipponense TaxID=159736 RepID=UPI0030C80210